MLHNWGVMFCFRKLAIAVNTHFKRATKMCSRNEWFAINCLKARKKRHKTAAAETLNDRKNCRENILSWLKEDFCAHRACPKFLGFAMFTSNLLIFFSLLGWLHENFTLPFWVYETLAREIIVIGQYVKTQPVHIFFLMISNENGSLCGFFCGRKGRMAAHTAKTTRKMYPPSSLFALLAWQAESERKKLADGNTIRCQ